MDIFNPITGDIFKIPVQDLSGYWQSDGASQPLGDWNLESYNITTDGYFLDQSGNNQFRLNDGGGNIEFFMNAGNDFRINTNGIVMSGNGYLWNYDKSIEADLGTASLRKSGNTVLSWDGYVYANTLLVNELSPYDSGVSFEVYGKGGFNDGGNSAYFATGSNAGSLNGNLDIQNGGLWVIGGYTSFFNNNGTIIGATVESTSNGNGSYYATDGVNSVLLCDGINPITINSAPGYTGALNDSTSTQIADVVGGIITLVYF